LKRPGRTAKPNSSISCSNSPAKEAQKNGSSNHIASSRGDLEDNGLLNGQEAGRVPAGGTETAKGDRRFIIRIQQEMNQFFMWGSARLCGFCPLVSDAGPKD
jgi:hypothetical protein